MREPGVRVRTLLTCAAAALLAGACGGRETGMVRIDPQPGPEGDEMHEIEYQASCRSGAECEVTSIGPEGRIRELFGSQWSHRFLASTGQPLYLGVTVRQHCVGNYALGSVRCSRASGFARVTIYVNGERVATDATFHRPRGVVPAYSFGVSTRHVVGGNAVPGDSMPADTIPADTVPPDSVPQDTARRDPASSTTKTTGLPSGRVGSR